MDIISLKKSVTTLIAKNKLDEAIDLLSQNIMDSSEVNEIILQSARFNDVKKQLRDGVIDNSEANQVKNQIRRNILELVSAIEEEVKYKREVFGKGNEQKEDYIIAFLSVGTPHHDYQKKYIDALKAHLLEYKIQLETLGSTFWALKNPLVALRKKMESVSGCVIVALERLHVKKGIYKSKSPQEAVVENEYYSTAWNQLEGGMAYQMNLPLLILKEEKLKMEGIFDGQLHEWMIVKINPENPGELKEGPVGALIKAWVDEVSNFKK
ncbi:MAG: hypothetical protein DHS20C18_02440 [Saprospiraceae bacterium]|nr:MAG: hypothetical protein DHS20C18_02440 [Saprospiraceae bacterium]